MSVIDIAVAMLHLQAEPEDQPTVQLKLDAAEQSAAAYLQRRFYADQPSLTADLATVPAARAAARTKFEADFAAVELMENANDRMEALSVATKIFRESREAATAISRGMVVNDAIKSACLLMLGSLFAFREDIVLVDKVMELPKGARFLLQPYRVEMGV